jgi:hypothetical protein
LYYDGYRNGPVLEPNDFIYDEKDLRLLNTDIMRRKAAAIMYMLRNTINKDKDLIQVGARSLFDSR